MRPASPLLLIVLCVAFAQITPAQQAPAKTVPPDQTEQNSTRRKREGAITGRVIGADGQPAPDAHVFARQISDKPRSQEAELADGEGNFKLTGLSPGVYFLNAYALGYVAAEASSEYDIHRIGENVTINLVKGGVITGRVTDETGEPIVNVSVIIRRLRDLDGKTTASQFESFGSRRGSTDDRGIYRIFGLPPGIYIVYVGGAHASSPDDAQVMRDTPTYYPSSTRETATEISLHSGEEVSGIDIRHRGERGRIISGAIIGGIESSSPYGSFWVTLKGFEVGGYEDSAILRNSRGFALYGVPDGEYELVAMSGPQSDETYSSIPRRISVKGLDVSGIELKLTPHGSIAGRIMLESSSPPKKCPINIGSAENQASGQVQEHAERESVIEEITLKTDRDDPNQRAQRSRFDWFGYGHPPNEKGEFALKGLEAGHYRITANLPDDGWRIRAIIQASQSGPGSSKPSTEAAGTAGTTRSPVDASRNGIAIKPGEKVSGVEVIVANGAASLSGRVVPAKEGMKLPPWLHAHLIPAEAASADDVIRYAETKVGADGSFEFKHIAPGKYLLHTRQVAEKEANDDQARPIAWDTVERAKLRREAATSKNEIELKVCDRVKEHVLRWQP
jgi:hypothetical protein